MRNPLVLLTILAGLASAPAFAQATSGGQAAQPGGAIGTTDVNAYNSTNVGSQYQQRRQIDNLPGQQNSSASADKLGRARPANKDELTVGATVNDKSGIAIAKIESVDADGVVVSTGAAKVKVPAEAFGHNKSGLLLDMTKGQFEQTVAKASAAS